MDKPISADLALHYLVTAGDVLEVDGRRFLVAPITDDLAETLAVALAATEDVEDDDPGGGDVEDEGEHDMSDAEDDDPGGDVLDRGEFDPCDLGEPEQYLDG